MPNSKTLVQTILAAFCAILSAHLSALGGGGMNIASRTGCWAKSSETPKYLGVELVGSGVSVADGWLSTTSNTSYGLLPVFSPSDKDIVFVCEIETASLSGNQGFFGGLGSNDTFTPFWKDTQPHDIYSCSPFIGTGGSVWDIARGPADTLGPIFLENTVFDLKFVRNGSSLEWYVANNGTWENKKTIISTLSIGSGNLQIGTNRGTGNRFLGRVNLAKSWIRLDGELWWEGTLGASKRLAD